MLINPIKARGCCKSQLRTMCESTYTQLKLVNCSEPALGKSLYRLRLLSKECETFIKVSLLNPTFNAYVVAGRVNKNLRDAGQQITQIKHNTGVYYS